MNSTKELIEDISNGRMVILVDDEKRENEGDLVMAAQFITPEAVNFMAQEARGLICLALCQEQTQKLGIGLMVGDKGNHAPNKTAFTVSIEAAQGVSTGISAPDRARTIRVATHPEVQPSDIIVPGHVFPICAQKGGVLKRAGHTEGSIDLARMAGLNPSGVICEIMNPNGTMARLPDLIKFAENFSLKIGSIEDLISYRLETETLIEEVAQSHFPHDLSKDFRVRIFKNILNGSENIVIQKGEIQKKQPTLVRVHVENLLADVLGGQGWNSKSSIDSTLKIMASSSMASVLVYLRQDRGPSFLCQQVTSKMSQKTFDSTLNMDPRDYGIGAQILNALGVGPIHLISSHKPKNVGLKGFGLQIVDVVTH